MRFIHAMPAIAVAYALLVYSAREEREAPRHIEEHRAHLSENLKGGSYLLFEDDSIYEISPEYWEATSLWVTPLQVRIEASGDPLYPDKIINLNTGHAIKGRKQK